MPLSARKVVALALKTPSLSGLSTRSMAPVTLCEAFRTTALAWRVRNGKLEHAIILDPVRQEEFTASRGRGAQLNGRRLRVSDRTDLKECLIGTGTPFWASQTIVWTGISKVG